MLIFDKPENCKDERAKETIDFYLSQAEAENLSLFYAVSNDFLLLMGNDADGAVFFAPEALAEDADLDRALSDIDEFAGAACIDKIFVGVDEQLEDYLSLRYKNHEISDMGEGFSAFRVLTELHALSDVSPVHGENVTLRLPKEWDSSFFRAVKEETKETLYGYQTENEDLLSEVLNEWEKRTAISFVLEKGTDPIGEMTLFSFDGRQTAKIAIRILASFRKKGFAKEALKEGIAFARDTLHLSRLKADVDVGNTASLALFSDLFIEEARGNAIVHFYKNL